MYLYSNTNNFLGSFIYICKLLFFNINQLTRDCIIPFFFCSEHYRLKIKSNKNALNSNRVLHITALVLIHFYWNINWQIHDSIIYYSFSLKNTAFIKKINHLKMLWISIRFSSQLIGFNCTCINPFLLKYESIDSWLTLLLAAVLMMMKHKWRVGECQENGKNWTEMWCEDDEFLGDDHA